MILSALLSATFTFTVTATGVEKGTAVEFLIAGANSDRAYESMFVLDEPLGDFCSRIDALVPRGTPVDGSACRLWPTGCRVSFDPPLEKFVHTDLPEGNVKFPTLVYTGGMRTPDGKPVAADEMPASVISSYSLPQSPVVFAEPFDQGAVYGHFTAAQKLEKGSRQTFRMTIDEKTLPRKLELVAEKGSLQNLIRRLRSESETGDIDVNISLSDKLTVEESVTVAQALAVIDSSKVKINGPKFLFYRAFLPLEKWRDRRERLHQPFELSLKDDGSDELVFIEEDWNVEGMDPKLTPRRITYAEASQHQDTDTCFVYASATQTVSRIFRATSKLASSRIVNWYVFQTE